MKKIFLLSIILVLFSGCFFDKENNGRVRVSVESRKNEGTEVKVWVEGKNGELIDGALVNSLTDGNILKTLEYNDKGFYQGTYSTIVRDNCTISVDSLQFDNVKNIEVPHKGITEDIRIESIIDENGNNVMESQEIKENQEIIIRWNLVNNASVYQIEIENEDDEIVYSATSQINQAVIGNEILQGSEIGKSYSIKISGQSKYGDPYYIENEYFSVSLRTSIDYNFYVIQ